MSAFEKNQAYNRHSFSDGDFASVQVYHSNSSASININMHHQQPVKDENVFLNNQLH